MDYEYRNIVKEPPTAEEIMGLAELGKMNVEDLLNRKSKTFKDLKVDIGSYSSHQVAELLQNNPKAMFRPILTDGKRAVVTFDTEKMKELLS